MFGWRGAVGFPREMAQIRGVWMALFPLDTLDGTFTCQGGIENRFRRGEVTSSVRGRETLPLRMTRVKRCVIERQRLVC